MNTESPTEKARHALLRTYVNDMIALEHEMAQAIEGQVEGELVKAKPDTERMLRTVVETSKARREVLLRHSEALDGKMGAKLKEVASVAAGTLASVYGKIRKHPVSKMLRDDLTALNLTATCYGMLYTTALAFRDNAVAETALEHLNELPMQIMEISAVLPGVIVAELAVDDPMVNPECAEIAAEAIEAAWMPDEMALPS